jgi:hypothetical protein
MTRIDAKDVVVKIASVVNTTTTDRNGLAQKNYLRRNVMMNGFFAMMHNYALLKDTEKSLNSFIDDPNTRIWFEDESGQRFVPHGRIKIGSVEMSKIIIEEVTE